MKDIKEPKTYMTIDGVHLYKDDVVWIASIDLDSFNYLPKELTIRECLQQGQTAFWSSEAKAQEECDIANRQ